MPQDIFLKLGISLLCNTFLLKFTIEIILLSLFKEHTCNLRVHLFELLSYSKILWVFFFLSVSYVIKWLLCWLHVIFVVFTWLLILCISVEACHFLFVILILFLIHFCYDLLFESIWASFMIVWRDSSANSWSSPRPWGQCHDPFPLCFFSFFFLLFLQLHQKLCQGTWISLNFLWICVNILDWYLLLYLLTTIISVQRQWTTIITSLRMARTMGSQVRCVSVFTLIRRLHNTLRI